MPRYQVLHGMHAENNPETGQLTLYRAGMAKGPLLDESGNPRKGPDGQLLFGEGDIVEDPILDLSQWPEKYLKLEDVPARHTIAGHTHAAHAEQPVPRKRQS